MTWFSSKKKNYDEDYIKAYLGKSFLPEKSEFIEQTTYCVLDCETTGLEKQDSLVSIGMVKVNNHQIDPSNVNDLKFEFTESKNTYEIQEELHKRLG
jgi:DNA polymerase III epsilon subunit-like protein